MHRTARLWLASAGLFILFLAPSARAQCTWPTLGSDVPVGNSAAASTWQFTATSGQWGAVGVRPAAGSNHDIAVFQNTAAPTACVANQVGASTGASGVDFVVGDFRPGRNAVGPWYPKVTRASGSGSGTVEWDAGGEEMFVDDPPLVKNTDQVIDVYQIFLEAGINYIVDFRPSPGVDAKVLIFRNPSAAPYWAGRSSRLLESATPTNYVAPVSDEYCVVVVNDDGGFSTYSLAIDQCQPPIDLVSGTAVSTAAPLRYRLQQSEAYWSAVGVRGTGTDDWNVLGYKTGRGALEPVCFKDSTCASNTPGTAADFIVGDFTYNPLSPFYARLVHQSGAALGIVEWDDGPDEIAVGAAPVARTTGPSDVLEVWDVFLTAGQPYTIYFTHSGSADVKFMAFENSIQSDVVPYWAGRSAAVSTGLAHTSYTPLVTGYHAIVVVNDNGLAGDYAIGVFGSGVGVEGGGGSRPTLEALVPNPTFARTQIAYSLPIAGRVGFEVFDVAGRSVARIAPVQAPAGSGRATWDGRGEGGRVAPGVYYVRMTFDGRRAGLSKLVILP